MTGGFKKQRGLSYIEVLVAMVLITVALVPAIDALQTGLANTGIHADVAVRHYSEVATLEEVLAEPWASLTAAAGDGTAAPSSYSDPAGSNPRQLVYIARYDATDSDGDGDPFTVPDPDSDGDGDPLTGYTGALRVRAVTEGGAGGIETLTTP